MPDRGYILIFITTESNLKSNCHSAFQLFFLITPLAIDLADVAALGVRVEGINPEKTEGKLKTGEK